MSAPFFRERAILSAVLDAHDGSDRPGEAGVLDRLLVHGLAGPWLVRYPAPRTLADSDAHLQLKRQRMHDAALYAAQRQALPGIDEALRKAGVPYLVMKGAHVREAVYSDGALRPAEDIDILVSRDRARQTAQALAEDGWALHTSAETISHEAALVRGPVMIDLHWDILRPGRTRVPMAEAMLARRVFTPRFPATEDTDTVFLMLVHPAFAKHVCAPAMTLVRALDFALWVRQRHVDWDLLARRLDEAGVKTAAWCVLRWMGMILNLPAIGVPADFIARIAPASLRRRYLDVWLTRNLPSELAGVPNAVQSGFTLALHDTPRDAARAVGGWLHSRDASRASPLGNEAGG